MSTPSVFALPGMSHDLAMRLTDGQRRVDELLARTVEHDDPFIATASGHLLAAGGKRFRPLLTLLAALACGEVTDEVIAAAAGVELTHLASLYHDDVMDSAATRRGVPSANAAYDNSTAILVGDLLFGKASEIVAGLGAQAVLIQAQTFVRLCSGQIRDTRPCPPDQDPIHYYLDVLADKTGVLVATAARYGAMFSGGTPAQVETMRVYGERLGVAFQLADDLIDITSDGEQSGKTPGTDLREGVDTLAVLIAKASTAPADAELRGLLGADLTDDHRHARALRLLRVHPAIAQARAQTRAVADEARACLLDLPPTAARDALDALAGAGVERVAGVARPTAPVLAERLARAVRDHPQRPSGPVAVLDLDAFEHNARLLAERAGATPIRLATKSIRVRALLEHAAQREPFRGLMAYSAAEAEWLAGHGATDLLVAYPSADAATVRRIADDPSLRDRIVLTIDSMEHVEWLSHHVPAARLRLCVDVDASLQIGRLHLGVRRSPLRDPDEVLTVVRSAHAAGHRVVGLMFYDAQIAGLPDSSPAVRQVKRRSDAQLRERRPVIVAAVGELADLAFVNGGGTGSLHVTGADPSLTELAAGSGLLAPLLFDGYDGLRLQPAAFFGLPVVRRPRRGMVTLFAGGYAASGPAGDSRLPRPLSGYGLAFRRDEGAGEVQTPVSGEAADRLGLGDLVWLRHAKAGEQFERFDRVLLVRGAQVERVVPTYRGEGMCFG